jgi:ACS family glucarate transporter-like MFS transporter
VVVRFLHGVGEAPTYPVVMTAISDWIPPRQHAFVNSLIFTGSTLGAAFAPPLVAQIMAAFGWRATFYLTAIIPVVVSYLWSRRTKHLPRPRSLTVERTTWNWHVLLSRNVFFLCLSYFLYCYAISIFVYWLFKYLVDVRHLSIVHSGWLNSVPWIAATVAVPATGYLSTRWSATVGLLKARRSVAVFCLLAAALLLYFGASAVDTATAISAIAVSVALLFSTESSYFSTVISLAGADAGSASGLMNLAGNLGGVAATTGVPLLASHYGWLPALLSGSVSSIAAAITWYGVKPHADALPLPIPGARA